MTTRVSSSALDEERRLPLRTSLVGHFSPAQPPLREFGFPAIITEPLFVFRNDAQLKAHPCYSDAKRGDTDAAITLVAELAGGLFGEVERLILEGAIPLDSIFVAPHAREVTGDNAIPQVLATFLSLAGGRLDTDIVQTSKVYHTGADPMERMNLRPSFHGRVIRGAQYVLVDDVTTLGGTLCDLSDFIRRGGGIPVAAVVIVNASRSGKLYPVQKTVAQLEKRFGNEIREIFNIVPRALTADEAQYLIGFRTAEEIRGRSSQARQKTDLRLRSKGIRFIESASQKRMTRHRVPFPGASAIPQSRRWIGKSRP